MGNTKIPNVEGSFVRQLTVL